MGSVDTGPKCHLNRFVVASIGVSLSDIDLVFSALRVQPRAAVIPALESAPESDFGSFQTTNRCDSGSGSFSLESLESAPLLEPIPTTKID